MTAPSPRTATEPMAFTFDEMARGVWLACGAFVVLLSIGLCLLLFSGGHASLPVLALTAIIGLMVGACGAAAAALVLAPAAWVLGRTLRRSARTGVHLVAFTALGLVTGLLGMGVFAAWTGFGDGAEISGSALWTPLTPIVVISATIAVPLGWWRASRSAIRRDLRGEQASFPDADAAYEDAL